MTSSPGDGTARFLTAEQTERILSAHLDDDASASAVSLHLAGELGAALAVDAAILGKQEDAWRVEASAQGDDLSTTGIRLTLDLLAAGPPTVVSEVWPEAGEAWTFVGCHSRPSRVIAIQGDWSAASAVLLLAARNASLMWGVQRSSGHARSYLHTYRLARRLSLTTGLQPVCSTLISEMAHAVDAGMGAIAVPDPGERHLSIVATHGYPIELVDHLKIDPREGVFGLAYQRGKALYVRHMPDQVAPRRSRPRYRTDSFVAMPIRAGKEILGVVGVTDRLNDEPFTPDHVATLRALAGPAALALGRERALVQAEHLALTAAVDPLSGVFNRRHFQVRLEEELQRALRHRLALAFLMIDIDDFKAVNDSYGHLAGDTVIKSVAEIIRRSVRVFDVCARFGGEEFAIIMPGTVVDTAVLVAERIRERIESHRYPDPALSALRLTVSIGVAVSVQATTGREIVSQADRALYLAKREGKNRVRVYADATLGPGVPPADLPTLPPDA